jgi:hypothetical protein
MLLHLPQLIYTNVEANDSPSRRRGFQIWLASPGLAEPVREAIAARLGDFALPAGVRPDSREGRGLRRYQFFRVRHEAIWVLAQTAPLADTDMFGRGGRFYTHALVLPEEEFEKAGFNPFAILNGGARFQAQISEGKQEPDWKLGRIAPAELTLTSAPSPSIRLAPEMIAALAAILQQAEAPPVVMAEPPTDLLAVLAALFPWLPPRLRRRAAFDTLAPSPAAAGLSRFAGVYSPAAFKLWRQPPPRLDAAGSVLIPALKADTFFRRLMTS